MAIINRKNITAFDRKNYIISVRKDKIYFSGVVCEKFKLIHGGYIMFNNDGDHWSFWATDDPDGFRLSSEGKNQIGLSVPNTALTRLFHNSLQRKIPVPSSFYVQETNSEIDGFPVAEILTKKTVDEMGKE